MDVRLLYKLLTFRDPEPRRLAEGLLSRVSTAKVLSTTERYASAFQIFRERPSCFEEVACLPYDMSYLLFILSFLLQ